MRSEKDIREYQKKYREQNREKLLAYKREWMRKKRREFKALGILDWDTGWKKKNKKFPFGIGFRIESWSRRSFFGLFKHKTKYPIMNKSQWKVLKNRK